MAHSDHLLMTGEQRKAFPAAAAWHPTQCANTHTNKYRHIDSHNDSHTCMQLLKETRNLSHVKTRARGAFFHSSPFCGVTSLHCSLLLSSVILCCTFAPSPSLHLFLPASSAPSFTSCCDVTDSVTQEQTERETEGGRGRECERGV